MNTLKEKKISPKKAAEAALELLKIQEKEAEFRAYAAQLVKACIEPHKEQKEKLEAVVNEYVKQNPEQYPIESDKKTFPIGEDVLVKISNKPAVQYADGFERLRVAFLRQYPDAVRDLVINLDYVNAKILEGDQKFMAYIPGVDRSAYSLSLKPAKKD